MQNHKSQFDPSRDTVGKIYRDLQIKNGNDPIIVGDMSNEMMKDLKVDIEEGLADCFKYSLEKKEGAIFYFMIHEKKDLQMKCGLCRVRHYFGFCPWPEDDTTVFKGDPKTRNVYFCWSLPHSSEMDNMLLNPSGLDPKLIGQVKAWKKVDLRPFGFVLDKKEGWIPNPQFKFPKIGEFHEGKVSES